MNFYRATYSSIKMNLYTIPSIGFYVGSSSSITSTISSFYIYISFTSISP